MEGIVRLEYGSEEWNEYRKTHIGGSDASVILGVNPWKTPTALYDEKTGLVKPKDLSGNKAVEYGRAAEEHITALYALEHPEYEVELMKDGVYVNDFMMASLDATLKEKATGRNGFLEIKTGELRRTADFAKWKDRIPDYYYTQVLHYFLTKKEFDFGIVYARLKEWFYDQERAEYYPIIKEMPYKFERAECLNDMEILYKAEYKYNQYLVERKRPPLRLPEI